MRILLAAGGTGGHINPALATAGEIKKQYPDAEILFVGTKDKMEAKLVPAAGFDFKTIDIAGFQRKLSLENIKRNIHAVNLLLHSTKQCKKIIEEFKPDVVVGFGCYVSGPIVRCAAKMGIKTAIHEQNAYPGVTNKTLAKLVDVVMVAVEKAEDYLEIKGDCYVTGLPVRGEILSCDRKKAREELGFDSKPIILSFGGSLGAKTVNNAMCNLISQLWDKDKCNFIHAYGQYGKWVPDTLKDKGVDIENSKNLRVSEYINDMDKCLAAADIVISRSGASTLSEIEAVGRASILIPSPNVAENHQYHNAMALVDVNGARVIEEKDLTDDKLLSYVDELIENPVLCEEMGQNAKKLSVAESQKQICNIIVSLVN